MIDLHSHTNHSDGTCTPAELLELAAGAGLRALAVTDHDTLSGYDEARRLARPESLELVCGIEITCRHGRGNVHLLAYFLREDPAPEFRIWLDEILQHRRERNARLAARLQELGYDVRVEEADALGRTMTGRPHFGRVLVAKGYAKDVNDAFDRILGEGAAGYVERLGPDLRETIARVGAAGGVTSLAHPLRVDMGGDDDAFVADLAAAGLDALEARHSLHSEADAARFEALAARHGLAVTGGSDYHGSLHGGIELGVPYVDLAWLERLRQIR